MTQTYATLWQALCYLSYDSLEAKDPAGGDSVGAAIEIAGNTHPQKFILLDAARDKSISFEGRLGARCDPPPSLADTWRDFHWAGHGSEFTAISADDWPKVEYRGEGQIDWRGIDWEGSKLKTPRGEFIDVRCLAKDLTAWHPGPGGKHKVRLKKRGRKTGSGSYAEADAPLVQAMKDRLDSNAAPTSVGAAAWEQAEHAVGGGLTESKAKRLERRFYESFPEFHSI